MNYNLPILVLALVAAAAHGFSLDQLIPQSSLAEEDNSHLGIYHGKKTTIEKHPYMVSVIDDRLFVCTGTIVSKTWVVTIAAPIYDGKKVKVCVGCSDPLHGDMVNVKTVVFHPKWPKSIDYNYACLRLSRQLQWSSKVQPIKLPDKEPKGNTNMVIAGWGYSGPKKGFGVLRQGTMRWLSQKACKSFFAKMKYEWTPRQSCAYNKGKITICLGDWGVAYVHGGRFYGMSTSDAAKGSCSSSAIPVVLADVHTVVAWMKKTTGA